MNKTEWKNAIKTLLKISGYIIKKKFIKEKFKKKVTFFKDKNKTLQE